MILWLLPDFSCLADAAHWLGDCAQLLCQSARLTIPIIIQIRTVNMVTVEKEKMMIGLKFNDTAAEESCMKMKKWQWAE